MIVILTGMPLAPALLLTCYVFSEFQSIQSNRHGHVLGTACDCGALGVYPRCVLLQTQHSLEIFILFLKPVLLASLTATTQLCCSYPRVTMQRSMALGMRMRNCCHGISTTHHVLIESHRHLSNVKIFLLPLEGFSGLPNLTLLCVTFL